MEQSIYRNNNMECKAACYCRLSKDDPNDGTSVSIETQKKVIGDYCENNGIPIFNFFCDDGFTGTNFDRPSFKQMMSAIEAGEVNTVIVKDLSRFGREHIMVDYYTQVYFPENDVRFIAILDGTDISRHNVANYDMPMLIKSIFNEFFPADTSMKVRQACITKAKHGEFIGSKAPYGYKKSPEDKHVLIFDEETEPIVRRIYDMAAYQGMGFQKIAMQLSREQILTPSALEDKRRGRVHKGDPYCWNLCTVKAIIQNKIYLGILVSGKRRKLSFKSKKIIKCNESECIVVPDICTPIVTPQIWEDAQKRIKERKVPSKAGHPENIFAGLLKCADCGYSMRISSSSEKRPFFACGGYKKPKPGGHRCTVHFVLYDHVYDTVLKDINAMLDLLNTDENKFRSLVFAKANEDNVNSREAIEKEIVDLKETVERSRFRYKQLYEDRLNGVISPAMFTEMASECERLRFESEEKLKALMTAADKQKEYDKEAQEFLSLVSEYSNVTALDKEILNRLIERITISETRPEGEKRQIKIKIYYKFLGNCEF